MFDECGQYDRTMSTGSTRFSIYLSTKSKVQYMDLENLILQHMSVAMSFRHILSFSKHKFGGKICSCGTTLACIDSVGLIKFTVKRAVIR